MVAQILKEVQVRMMPEHNDHGLLGHLDPSHHQIHYILKVPTE
jgi:hypothetical protein